MLRIRDQSKFWCLGLYCFFHSPEIAAALRTSNLVFFLMTADQNRVTDHKSFCLLCNKTCQTCSGLPDGPLFLFPPGGVVELYGPEGTGEVKKRLWSITRSIQYVIYLTHSGVFVCKARQSCFTT